MLEAPNSWVGLNCALSKLVASIGATKMERVPNVSIWEVMSFLRPSTSAERITTDEIPIMTIRIVRIELAMFERIERNAALILARNIILPPLYVIFLFLLAQGW